MRSTKEAFRRHPEVLADPRILRPLFKLFEVDPPDSTRALLTKMGPFVSARHGFRFGNSFDITEDNVAQVRQRATRIVVERALETVAFGPLGQALRALKIPIPLLPDISLPASIISEVIEIVTPQGINFLIDKIGGSLGRYGRCGGMAFAGYDFYLLGWPVDERLGDTPPSTGPLGDYIFDRLLDSLELNIRTFLEWVAKLHVVPLLSRAATAALLAVAGNSVIPGLGAAVGAFIGTKVDIFGLGGEDAVLADSKVEWTRLKEALDREAARPVGLIFKDSAVPWDQHQVLAVGYKDKGNGTGRLRAWDNNRPGSDRVYDLDFRGSGLLSQEDQKLKGFFVESYSPRVPPLALKLE